MNRWIAGLVPIVTAFAVAAPVHAATLSRTGATVTFAAGTGEENTPRVAAFAGTITVTDANDVIAGAGCATDAITAVTGCGQAGVTRLVLRLGDLDDRMQTAQTCR